MAAKYYIYARGRWCEVDARNGRVEGFKERARFLFFRGGKVELARTATVLRGLRALAGGKPGPVRDGPPLPLRKRRRHRRRSRRERDSRARAHHGCCLHGRCDVNANLRDKLSLPSLPAPLTLPSPRKRRIIYSDESPQQYVDKSPVKETQKFQKQTDNEPVVESAESSSEEVTKRPTRSTVSKLKKDSKIEDRNSSKLQKVQKQTDSEYVLESVESSSEAVTKRPTRSTASKIEGRDSSKLQKVKKQTQNELVVESVKSSNEELTKRPTPSTASNVRKDRKREDRDSSKLQKVQKQTHNKLVIEIDESSNEENTKRPTKRTASKVRKDSTIEDGDSSKEQVRSPRKLNGKEIVSIKDDREKSKKATKKDVSVKDAEQLLLRLSDSEDSDTYSNCSEMAKELVIDEDDVIVLRRFMLKRGIGDLDRFDNDEEYKRRVFYKLNPLVTLERCKPLENLLRQKMTLIDFARNLGLRSVAEVTPEKRYRMRPSTKLARAVDSETDKENIVKPKRRKLWDNDKQHFTSIASRSSDIKPRQIPKPALNEDSSKDTTDSDTEFKRKVREQLTRKSKQRASATEREKETTSSIVTEKEQRRTRSSIRGPGPLKEQNKPSENKDKGNRARVASSEDVSRRTRSSDRGLKNPVGALKEQNKGTDSSDSAFETSKLSPKKAAAKETVRNTGEASQKRNKKGKFVKEGKKVDERVEKMTSAVVRSMTVQPVRIKASSVPPGREYTSLEDHAIVAWVSMGGRERRVNGNALWRELQAEYPRITGQDRSWHSLRNRYLRYVLPSLGRLALPPQQVSRLRAAAAAGVLKAGSGPPRRNSIYGAPAVPSASARGVARPPPKEPPAARPPAAKPPQDKHTSPKTTVRSPRRAPPPPSPSYSAITRRFATRASAPLTSSPLRAIKRKK